ncbi:hypothetical protein FRB94_003719 [Tulasnella sp. JGI-2019a]|nr:hypothetical protein FRB94_003719 [Tulasnella sp. JGI-2019a]
MLTPSIRSPSIPNIDLQLHVDRSFLFSLFYRIRRSKPQRTVSLVDYQLKSAPPPMSLHDTFTPHKLVSAQSLNIHMLRAFPSNLPTPWPPMPQKPHNHGRQI